MCSSPKRPYIEKLAFRSPAAARKYMRARLAGTGARGTEIYHCPDCGEYHLRSRRYAA